MKKLSLILACSILSCFSVSVKASNPENLQGAEIKIVNVEKEGGRRCVLGIFGAVRYDHIYCHPDIKYITNPETGHQDRVETTDIKCEGPGNEACDYTGGISSAKTGVANEVEDFSDKIINSLLDQIDENLLEKEIYSGSIGKKYVFTPEGNKPVYLYAEAKWDKGNSNGDAKIVIKVYNITDKINGILH